VNQACFRLLVAGFAAISSRILICCMFKHPVYQNASIVIFVLLSLNLALPSIFTNCLEWSNFKSVISSFPQHHISNYWNILLLIIKLLYVSGNLNITEKKHQSMFYTQQRFSQRSPLYNKPNADGHLQMLQFACYSFFTSSHSTILQ